MKREEKHTPFQQSDVTPMSRYYSSIPTVLILKLAKKLYGPIDFKMPIAAQFSKDLQ